MQQQLPAEQHLLPSVHQQLSTDQQQLRSNQQHLPSDQQLLSPGHQQLPSVQQHLSSVQEKLLSGARKQHRLLHGLSQWAKCLLSKLSTERHQLMSGFISVRYEPSVQELWYKQPSVRELSTGDFQNIANHGHRRTFLELSESTKHQL